MKNFYIVILLLSILALSCKRDADKFDQLGPKYITTEEAFSVSAEPADFSEANVYFKAKLTVASLWKIEVRGLNSGAVKRFSATSQIIDISNTEWDSSSDTTIAFQSEPCTATLYIPASGVTKRIQFNTIVYTGPFDITQALAISANPADFSVPVYFTAGLNKVKNWTITITGNTSGATKIINGSSKILSSTNTLWDGSSDSVYFFRTETCQAVISFPDTNLTQSINFTISVPKTHPGYLISDFETTGFGSYLGSNTGTYFDAPDMASSTIDIYSFSPAPQGSKVLRYDCNDVTSNYYTGGVYHNSAASNYGIPSVSSDDLYLNLFIYGYSGGNAALSIELGESDGDKWQPTQISVNWIGWKLVSLKYSLMSNSAGTGNITKESNKINAVNMSMNSIPPGNNCRALVDYLIFTTGAPLQP